MIVKTHLDLPSSIAARMLSGEMVRRGGVIQWADGTAGAGRVVAWLREAAPQPSAAAELGGSLLSKAGSVLNLVGGVASVLNLGATVAFGVSHGRKLNKLLTGQAMLQEGQQQLQQSVDAGFARVLAGQAMLQEGQQQLQQSVDAWVCAGVGRASDAPRGPAAAPADGSFWVSANGGGL